MSSFSHTRIAPTPSGYLHIGNALNFLLTAALAKQTGATLLLRIDDMDRERLRPEYLQDVFDTLQWLAVEWQEGPKDVPDFEANWSQRDRMKLYNAALQQLRNDNLVFACNCSRMQTATGSTCHCREKQLSLDVAGTSWRVVTNRQQPITVQDVNGESMQTSLSTDMQDFVVRRKDGLPAYQLTSLVDDVHFGIDLIIRGQDLWPSTLAQLYLAGLLRLDAFTRINFFHHPLLLNDAGVKLSKSAGDSSLKKWQQSGKTKADLLETINCLLRNRPSAQNSYGMVQEILNTHP